MTTPAQRDRILKKAYEIWESEGKPTGRDMEHWLQAEVAILQENGKKKSAVKTKAKTKAKAKAKTKTKAKAKTKTKAKTKAKAKTKE